MSKQAPHEQSLADFTASQAQSGISAEEALGAHKDSVMQALRDKLTVPLDNLVLHLG